MGQFFNTVTAGFGITDVIDIAIVAFVLYKISGFIKTNRAEQLAKGILVVFVAEVIAGACHFYVTDWALKRILEIGLIALIILFQPELRRALTILGRNNFRSSVFSMEEASISGHVKEIVRAVDSFSARKEGAIILIERGDVLDGNLKNSTILDSNVSSELIENIFYKGSPLHDGAAVIRGDRIYAAGCVLPLTENASLSKDLGTRHRAALGITEVSDCVAIVVSEESGVISLAEGGRLSRFLDSGAVEERLLEMYLSDKENSDDSLLARLAAGLAGFAGKVKGGSHAKK